jgi:hypothetical protein
MSPSLPMLNPMKPAAIRPAVRLLAPDSSTMPSTVMRSIICETRGPKKRSKKMPVRRRPIKLVAPMMATDQAAPAAETPRSVSMRRDARWLH